MHGSTSGDGTPGVPVVTPPQGPVPVMPGGAAGSGSNGTPPAMMEPSAPTDSSPDEDGGIAPGDTHNPLFVGLWVIEHAASRDYQGTLYELQQGGDMLERGTFELTAAPFEGYVTGTVASGPSGPRCAFAERWQSESERRLRVDSHCSDGANRSVVLSFPDGDESDGLVPAIESVDGMPGWTHADRDWTFRKCKSAELCFPF